MRPYFEQGGVTLYNCDCRDVQPTCDLIVTDPPYGQEFVSGKAGGKWGMLIGDDDKEGVEAALNDGPEASTITPMALDASLAFEVYEIDEEAPEEGDPTTALVRARGDYLRLRNLEAARAAGWTARIAGPTSAPSGRTMFAFFRGWANSRSMIRR